MIPFAADNILLVPPIYCLLGRIPFWLTDTLLLGSSPSIFSFQHPSLAAVYVLIILSTRRLVARIAIFCGGCAGFRKPVVARSPSSSLRSQASIHLLTPPELRQQQRSRGLPYLESDSVSLDDRATWKTWLLYALILLSVYRVATRQRPSLRLDAGDCNPSARFAFIWQKGVIVFGAFR